MKPTLLAGTLVMVIVGSGCSAPEPTGAAAIYSDQGCTNCHGAQLEGRRTAPPLTGLADHWSAEDLATYLRDPKPFLEGSTRLRAQAVDYPIPMPAYPDLADDELAVLVAYLLAFETPD